MHIPRKHTGLTCVEAVWLMAVISVAGAALQPLVQAIDPAVADTPTAQVANHDPLNITAPSIAQTEPAGPPMTLADRTALASRVTP